MEFAIGGLILVAMLCLVHGLLLVLSERLTYLGLVLMGSAAGINQTASNTGSPLKRSTSCATG